LIQDFLIKNRQILPIKSYVRRNCPNIFIAPTVCTTHGRKSYKIVPLTNFNEYLHNESSGMGGFVCKWK
jgi:hypothetical protein